MTSTIADFLAVISMLCLVVACFIAYRNKITFEAQGIRIHAAYEKALSLLREGKMEEGLSHQQLVGDTHPYNKDLYDLRHWTVEGLLSRKPILHEQA